MLHPRTIDITGKTFGKLTVVEFHDYVGTPKRAMWLCKCKCGNNKITGGNDLIRGMVASCGCLRKMGGARTHGEANHINRPATKEWRAWSSMRARCLNQQNASYDDYGGRGIKVSPKWDKYETFLYDVGRAPSSDHSLDRIDVNGDYEPNNVRWATYWQQAMNKRGPIPRYVGASSGILSFGC